MKIRDFTKTEERPIGFFAMSADSQLVSLWKLTTAQVALILNIPAFTEKLISKLPKNWYKQSVDRGKRIWEFNIWGASQLVRLVSDEITLKVKKPEKQIDWIRTKEFLDLYFKNQWPLRLQQECFEVLKKGHLDWFGVWNDRSTVTYFYIKSQFVPHAVAIMNALMKEAVARSSRRKSGKWRLSDKEIRNLWGYFSNQ